KNRRQQMAAQPDRSIHLGGDARARFAAIPSRRSTNIDPAAIARFDRFAADARGNRRIYQGRVARRLRQTRRPPLAIAALRRAMGAALAGPGALRRYE